MSYRILHVDMNAMHDLNGLNKDNVGQAVHELRMRKNLLLREIADRAGMSVSALSLIERGARRPLDRTFYRLVRALNELAA